MSARRKWTLRLIAVAGGACLAVLACEGTLRLVPGLLPSGLYQMLRADPREYGVPHPYIGHLHTPNQSFVVTAGTDFTTVHHTGAHGFRNSSPWPDQADIVVLGDSLTFGYGVTESETWPALLAHAIGPTRLVNLGLVGGGPQQYLRVYETFGIGLRPKLVIVGFFSGNDFSNAETFDRWLKSGVGGNYMVWRDFGQPRRVDFSLRHLGASLESWVAIEVHPYLRKSYLFNLLRTARTAVTRGPSAQPVTVRLSGGREIQLSRDDVVTEAARARPGQREFDLTLAALEQIHTTAARNGAHTLIVLQPSKEEVYLPLLNVETPDLTWPLREALRSRGIDYLDLGPEFRRRAAGGEQLFYRVDGHPNAAGYALTAGIVGSYIRANVR